MIRLLAISGSLRKASINTALLRAAALLAPKNIDVQLYESLGELPHFNPDLDTDLNASTLPQPVRDLRAQVDSADGLLIACPEYAHGLPGAFKNALDWLVGGPEFIAKPVALLNTSPRSVHATPVLTEIISTMAGCIVMEACQTIPLRGRRLGPQAIVENPELAGRLRSVLLACDAAIGATGVQGNS